MNGPDERLSSSDHSDKYSQIYMYGSENGEILSSKKRHIHSGKYCLLHTVKPQKYGVRFIVHKIQ